MTDIGIMLVAIVVCVSAYKITKIIVNYELRMSGKEELEDNE